MEFRLYTDIKAFYRDTYEVLMRHEAQNLVPLGNIIIGNSGKDKAGWRDPANWFMAAVTDSGALQLTAIMTPPHNLTIYATDNRISETAIDCLVKGIAGTGVTVPGLLADKNLAEVFSKAWSAAKGVSSRIHKNMRIYELLKVNPEIPLVGTLRLAEENDMSFLPYWIEGFNFDCFGNSPAAKPDLESYRYHVTKQSLYFLEVNGTPVSMAQRNREMQTVCGVGQVYTPPYFRGKGYASSCVAALSLLILERGFKKCVLYTDLANPVSNSIYQKIGYRPICDSLEIRFE